MLRLTTKDYNSEEYKRTVEQELRACLLIQKPLVINAFTDVVAAPKTPSNNNLQMVLKKPEDFKQKALEVDLRERLLKPTKALEPARTTDTAPSSPPIDVPITALVPLYYDYGVPQKSILENYENLKKRFADANRHDSLMELFGDFLRTKNFVAIKYFIKDQDPNLKGSLDKTRFHPVSLLHRVSLYGTPQSVAWIQQLLARGADVSVADYQGWTPIHFAIATSNEAAVQYYKDQNLVTPELVEFAHYYSKSARILSGITQEYMPLSNDLPTVFFRISDNDISIVIQHPNGNETVLHQGISPLFESNPNTIILELDDFSFTFDKKGMLSLVMKQNAFNVEVVSKKPLVLDKKLEVLGSVIIKAPRTNNNQEIIAREIIVKGVLVNRGTLLANQLLLQHASGHARAITLDNEQGKIMTRGAGKLFVDHAAINNQHGLIQGQHTQIVAHAIDNRYGAITSVEQGVILSKGSIQNQHGCMVCDEQDLRVQSQLGTITCLNSGWIKASKGTLIVQANKIIVDESSLVSGYKGTKIKAKKHAHFETTILSQDLSLNGSVLDVACGLYSDHDVHLKQTSSNHLVLNKPIRCGNFLHINTTYTMKSNLSFHLSEGRMVREPFDIVGDLYYKLATNAQMPLWFLANQKGGNLTISTPTASMVGDEHTDVTLEANKYLKSQSKSLDLHRGRLLSVEGMQLRAADIVLGRETAPQAAIQSHGTIEMEAANRICWNQLEMIGGTDLHLKGTGCLLNTSSHIWIEGNAFWEMPTRHQLLVKKNPGSEAALTKPATVIIKGNLNIGNNNLELFASKISCKAFEGTPPDGAMIQTFIPFTTGSESYVSDYGRRRHTFHSDDVYPIYSTRPTIILGLPVIASFSIGSDLDLTIPGFDISGIIAALSIKIKGIRQGYWGQFDTRVSMAPMVSKAFKDQVALIDYLEPSLLYTMSPGGDTVFKPVLPRLRQPVPQMPRMLLRKDGTLGINMGHLRRLFTREQEEQLVMKVMLKEFSKGFISREYNTPQSIMQYLEANTLRYSQRGQKLIGMTENPGMLVRSDRVGNSLNLVKTGSMGEVLLLSEPCIVDKSETLIWADGHTEEVVQSIVFFPKHFDNQRLRDGAGACFALGPVTFEGVEGSALYIRAHIDAEGVAMYQNFDLVSRTVNTFMVNETLVDESTQKSIVGKNKTRKSCRQMQRSQRQPGNEARVKGERYVGVKHVHRSGVNDTLGEDGLSVEGATSFVDEGILQNYVAASAPIKQKGLLGLGGSTTVSPRVSQRTLGSVVQSEGRVRIQALYAQLDDTQFRDAHGHEIQVEFEVQELHFHELLRVLEVQEREAVALLAAQEKTAKRKRRQKNIWMLLSLPVSYYLGGAVQGWLQSTFGLSAAPGLSFAQDAFLNGVRGSVIGGSNARFRGANPLRGMAEGLGFAVFGTGMSHILGDTAQTLAGQTFHAASVAAAQTAVHGGNFAQNLLGAGAATALAGAVLPMDEQHMAELSPAQASGRILMHAGVASATVAALNGSHDFVMNTFIEMTSAIVAPVADASGRELGERIAQPRQQRVQPRIQVVETAEESSSAPAPARRRGVQPSARRPTPLEQALLERSVQTLRAQGEIVNERDIRSTLDAHSSALLIAMGEQAYATDLGFRIRVMQAWQRSQARAQGGYQLVSATVPPPEFMGLAVLESLLLQQVAYGSEHMMAVYPRPQTSETMLPMYHRGRDALLNTPVPSSRKPFRLDSVLPDSDPNPFLNYTYALGRGIERGRDCVADAVLHPIDTAIGLGVAVWDGYNALSDLAFGLSTQGARARNNMRGHAVVSGYEQFIQADGAKKLETASMFVTTSILGTATAASTFSAVGKVAGRPLVKLYDARRAGSNVQCADKIIENYIKNYLGKDFRIIRNKSGDAVFISSDNARKIRFDIKNPHGYEPHCHIEYYDKGTRTWLDYTDQHHIHFKNSPNYLNKPKPKP